MTTEHAWAAGLFDGEGSTCPYGRPRKDGTRGFIRMTLSQKNTGPELLLRFQAALGTGKVKERTDRPGVWVWTCNTSGGCQQALERMWPYLSTPKNKKNQAIGVGYGSAGK